MIGPSDSFLNPKKPFNSITEASNYVKAEMNDDKVMEYLRKSQMPINSIDPRVNHNATMRALKKIPIKKEKHKLYHQILVAKSLITAQNAIRGVHASPDEVRGFIASWLKCEVEKIRETEVEAIDYVKKYLKIKG